MSQQFKLSDVCYTADLYKQYFHQERNYTLCLQKIPFIVFDTAWKTGFV